jgi:hypothetical protein
MDFIVAAPQYQKVTVSIDTLIEGLMAICVGGPIKVDEEGLFICLNFWEPEGVPLIKERLVKDDPRLELVEALKVIRRFHDAGLAKLNMDAVKIAPAVDGKVIKPEFKSWPGSHTSESTE